MIKCKICNEETKYKTITQFYQRHLKTAHNITIKQYYTKFFLKEAENICKTCGKESLFFNFEKGYRPYCSKSCAAKNPETTRKYKETMLERHGVENVYQMEAVKDKIKSTCLERYGVDNPSRSKIIIDKIKDGFMQKYGCFPCQLEDIKDKIKHTNLIKYGVNHPLKNKKVADRIGITHRKSNLTVFKIGLKNKDIILLEEDKYIEGKEFKVKCLECGSIFTSNVGGYIHLINCEKCKKTFKSQKDYHKNKYKHFKNLGIDVIQIMEGEWINKKDIVKSIILSKLGIYKERIFARKCELKNISSMEYRVFLEENHLQGHCNSSIRLGLFFKEKLISCIGVGRSRFEKETYELHRYCTNKNTQVVGGFSKLLKHCPIKNMVTYCDLRYSSGKIYLQNGFSFVHETVPSFYYYHKSNPLVLYSRRKFQKHKLINILDVYDDMKTAEENLAINKYVKIYDAGCYKFKRSE